MGLLVRPAAATEAAPIPRIPVETRGEADLPDRIPIKTPTQTFNHLYYFAILDGRIYYRSNPETTGVEAPWRLLGDTGLPQPYREDPGFATPSAIASIHADAAALAALSASGRFYYLPVAKDSPRGRYDVMWWDVWGFPWPGDLRVEEGPEVLRGWAIGRRASDVLYYEDIDGNPHNYGVMGISTLYVLAGDGTHIHYTDSGLPPSIGRTLCGPERGRYRAEAISASASTMMTIDASGRIYTRLADFDTIGADTLLYPYTYTGQHRPEDRGSDPGTRYHPWSLPSESWLLQPDIPLFGAAGLSRGITILQTGQGNAARELRVAGRNSSGQPGYYHKSILEPMWKFEESADISPTLTLLQPPDGLGADALEALPPPGDGRYVGTLDLGPWGQVEVELPDFNLICSPGTLRLSRAGRTLDLSLYLVEAWSPRPRRAPGRDGGPKVFHGTLVLSPGILGETDPELRAWIEGALLPLDRLTFALMVFAKPSGVEIRGPSGPGQFELIAHRVDGDPAQWRADDGAEAFTQKALDAATALHGGVPPDWDVATLEGRIYADHALKIRLRSQLAVQREQTRRSVAMALALSTAGGLMRITGLALLPPPVGTVAAWVGPISRAQAKADLDRLVTAKADHAAAKAIIDARITVYEERIDVLKDARAGGRQAGRRD